MNRFKPLIVSLLLWSSLSSLASADNNNQSLNEFAFAGVGIGSSQYLGVYLSNPPAPAKPLTGSDTPPPVQVCNMEVRVSGMDGLPIGDPLPAQSVSQGATVFLKVGETANSASTPEYFKVSVKITSASTTGRGFMGCRGVTAALGVYDKVTQDLQVSLPMPQK